MLHQNKINLDEIPKLMEFLIRHNVQTSMTIDTQTNKIRTYL